VKQTSMQDATIRNNC